MNTAIKGTINKVEIDPYLPSQKIEINGNYRVISLEKLGGKVYLVLVNTTDTTSSNIIVRIMKTGDTADFRNLEYIGSFKINMDHDIRLVYLEK